MFWAALLGTAFFMVTHPAPASAQGNAPANTPVLIELFTSQGCSSCPPADRLLGELTKRRDVVALTLPVDYWDYLGWKDTLASPANSKRQRVYARARRDRQVYTPQMVLNGRTHAVGSRRHQVFAEIKRQSAAGHPRVPMTLTSSGDAVTVSAAIPPDALKGKRATIWLAMYKRAATIAIKRGENSGKSITYHNVVRQMLPLGHWTGKPMQVTLPKSELITQGYDGCVAILQINDGGPVIGLAYINDLKSAKASTR